MSRYENETWKLLNVDELPKIKSGTNKGWIDNKKCVGITLKYELKANGVTYEIKIVDYIEEHRDENNKRIHSKFKVEYIYFKGTEYEEVIEKAITCDKLINRIQIGGIIPSFNQWIKKGGYWVGIDIKGREFSFNTNNKETESKILHSTWCINVHGYVSTGNLNNSGQKWIMHKAIFFNCNKEDANKNTHMYIDHINNKKADNRLKNLRLATASENSKNKKTNNEYGLVGLQSHGKGYRSRFMIERHQISTKTKYNLEEAKMDNLITQKHLGYKHNEDQFYKLEQLSEERIKEVTDWLDRKIEENRNKIKKEKEYKYSFEEKDGKIGIKTFKKDETENPTCWVDKDFGKIERDKYVINGYIHNTRKYFQYNINGKNYGIHNYILVGGVSLQNYRNNNFHIDHINQKTNENYRDNIEIATHKSNMMNKESKGYSKCERKDGVRYRIQYANNWDYFNLYIGGLKTPYFNTQEEAIAEFKRRKEIVNKYRFRIGWQGSKEDTMKVLDEIIDFAEEHKLDLDSAYIVWKGLDIEENIKNYLNSIDK